MCLCLYVHQKKIHHVSTIVSHYAAEGVDVLYNLPSVSLEKSPACALKLGQRRLCQPVAPIRQTGCVMYRWLVFTGQQPWDHLSILSVKWSTVPVLNRN